MTEEVTTEVLVCNAIQHRGIEGDLNCRRCGGYFDDFPLCGCVGRGSFQSDQHLDQQ